jgi:hypothetical protein
MIHESLAAGRWQTMTLPQQLGNAGSEFERALSWKNQGVSDKFESALERFVELMDLTVSDPRWRGPRRRELARVKEHSLFLLTNDEKTEDVPLQNYFLQFALLARSGK